MKEREPLSLNSTPCSEDITMFREQSHIKPKSYTFSPLMKEILQEAPINQRTILKNILCGQEFESID
jgi:hypothetical protein